MYVKNIILHLFPIQDRLIANEFIQCRKVCEHVIDKILGADDRLNNITSSNNSQSDGNSEGSQIPPEERIELLCNDTVSLIAIKINFEM